MIARTLMMALMLASAGLSPAAPATARVALDLKSLERDRVLPKADQFLTEQPVTVTASRSPRSPRSAGGPHDFFSEGDYWWPDPQNPSGPYIQRDGQTNPNLQYAQAIKGITTGRGIGIIDTVHLIEPARSAGLLQQARLLDGDDLVRVPKWFSDYLTWITTSKNGLDEMRAENNHGACWVMQVATFASFTGDEEKLAMCRKRYKEALLPKQMAPAGSFPRELKRTKPYGTIWS